MLGYPKLHFLIVVRVFHIRNQFCTHVARGSSFQNIPAVARAPADYRVDLVLLALGCRVDLVLLVRDCRVDLVLLVLGYRVDLVLLVLDYRVDLVLLTLD